MVDAGAGVIRRHPVIEPVEGRRGAVSDAPVGIGRLIERDDVAELFREIREAHEAWDGVTEPVRVRSKSSSLPTPTGAS